TGTYMIDSKDFMYSHDPDPGNWYTLLYPYIKPGAGALAYDKMPLVFNCPSDPFFPDITWSYDRPSFGFNRILSSRAGTSIRSPGQTIHVSDSGHLLEDGASSYVIAPNVLSLGIWPRHLSGAASVLWVDTHATSMSDQERKEVNTD